MSEPIYALDLDEDLLSHITDPEAWLVLNAEQFRPDMINDEEIRAIYLWQREHLREHKQPATAVVLGDEFDLELHPPETAIGDLLDRFRERYAKNQGRKALKRVIEEQQGDPVAIPKLLLKTGRELNDLLTKRGEMFDISDVQRAHHRYDKKVLSGPGASVGFPDIDEYFFGMRGITIWLAPPKTYKSWIMCRGVLQNVVESRNVWIYSLELPAEETDMRLRCMLSDVPWWHYIRNCITPDEWKTIADTSEYLDSQGGDFRIVKPAAGHRGIDEMVYTARDGGADVIFIDQLQYVEAQNGQSIGSLNQTGSYWEVLNRSRDLSDDGPICIAHQFNRQAMFSDGLPPIEYAKGSSSIEEVSTLALGMWANRDMRKSGKVDIGTLISRNHEYATWRMNVNLSSGCSFEIDERVYDDDDEAT